MGSFNLRKRHWFTILRYFSVRFLDLIHLKNLIRGRIERNNPVFKEEVDIFEGNKSIIVFPNIPWDYRWQRPQQIFSRLGKKNFNIFYLSPITSSSEYIVERQKGVYELHIKSERRVNILRDLNINNELKKEILESIKELIGKYVNNATCFVLHPIWFPVVKDKKNWKLVYDMMDLYSGFTDAKVELIRAEEELLKKSDLIITSAENLNSFAKKYNEKVVMVRNGCDLDRFVDIKKNGQLDSIKGKPIVGYFGAINDWFDVEAVEYAVKENAEKNFVFLGNIDTKKVEKLFKYKNVYFLGEVKHEELGGYLAYFDVCTIPFVINELIKSTNPVKFYEYVATGKPVVSSKLPELEKYSDICYLYDGKEDFSKCIYKALYDKEESTVEKRIRVAKQNSWDERIKVLQEAISNI